MTSNAAIVHRLLVATCLLSGAAAAQPHVLYVPGMTNITGLAGTHFSSDLKVRNLGTAATLVSFDFLPASGEAPPPVSRSVGASQTLSLRNVLAELFARSESFGALRVASDQPIVASARTYNDANPAGTYGLAIEPVPDLEMMRPGDVRHLPWVSHTSDLSRGYRTNVAILLAAAGSSVDVVVFDERGGEAGRATLGGGPGFVQRSISSMTGGDLAVGRVELRATAGKSTGYLAVVDNVTGDGIVVQPFSGFTSGVDQLVDGVVRSGGLQGTFFQTDLRLQNLSGAAAEVTVTPVSIGGLTTPATVSVPANGVVEIVDVLGQLFQAAEGAVGALRIQSVAPVLAVARTSNVKRDGTPGTFGAYQKAVALSSFLPAGVTATLIGVRHTSAVPGFRTNLAFLGGPDGATVALTLKDASGRQVATSEAALLPFTWSQRSLSGAFGDAAVPEDATLELEALTGSFDAYTAEVDNGTGDSVIRGVRSPLVTSCAPPTISSFYAAPVNFPSGVDVTLSWSVAGADSVTLLPAGSPQPPSGTLVVKPAASTRYTLEAGSPCGTTRREVLVAVGDPAISVAPATAEPGQEVAVTLANLGNLEDVSRVQLSFADGVAVTAQVTSAEPDRITFVVPSVGDSGSDGYRTGAAQVQVLYRQKLFLSTPFTIRRLTAPADPVAALRALITARVASAKEALAAQKQHELAVVATALDSHVDALAAILQKAADDLAASGTATMALSPAVPGQPAPATVQITTATAASAVALLTNVASVAGGGARDPLAGALYPCAKDDPRVPYLAPCAGQNLGALRRDFERITRQIATLLLNVDVSCKVTVRASSIWAPLLVFARLEAAALYTCAISPVSIVPDFIENSDQDPRPFQPDQYGRITLRAELHRIHDPEDPPNATSFLEEAIVVAASLVYISCNNASTLHTAATAALAPFLTKNPVPTPPGGVPPESQVVTLGSCDIAEMRVEEPQYLAKDPGADGPGQGQPSFRFKALAAPPSGATQLRVTPRLANFFGATSSSDLLTAIFQGSRFPASFLVRIGETRVGQFGLQNWTIGAAGLFSGRGTPQDLPSGTVFQRSGGRSQGNSSGFGSLVISTAKMLDATLNVTGQNWDGLVHADILYRERSTYNARVAGVLTATHGTAGSGPHVRFAVQGCAPFVFQEDRKTEPGTATIRVNQLLTGCQGNLVLDVYAGGESFSGGLSVHAFSWSE